MTKASVTTMPTINPNICIELRFNFKKGGAALYPPIVKVIPIIAIKAKIKTNNIHFLSMLITDNTIV